MSKSIIAFLIYLFLSVGLHCTDADQQLENAYRSMFTKEFGYTLIGEKPISFEEDPINEFFHHHPEEIKNFVSSMQNAFRMSKTVIFKAFLERDGSYYLEIIHKPALTKLLFSNQKLKDFIISNFHDVDNFYRKIEDPHVRVIELFRNNAYLKGILLGYGDTNAHYFCRRSELLRHMRKLPSIDLLSSPESSLKRPIFQDQVKVPFLAKKLAPSPGLTSLEDEWNWMTEISWDLRKEREVQPPFLIALPFYVCCHGGDSEIVRKKYIRASVKLSELFNNKSFQQAVADLAAEK